MAQTQKTQDAIIEHSDTERMDWLERNASKLGIKPDWTWVVVDIMTKCESQGRTRERSDIRRKIDTMMSSDQAHVVNKVSQQARLVGSSSGGTRMLKKLKAEWAAPWTRYRVRGGGDWYEFNGELLDAMIDCSERHYRWGIWRAKQCQSWSGTDKPMASGTTRYLWQALRDAVYAMQDLITNEWHATERAKK